MWDERTPPRSGRKRGGTQPPRTEPAEKYVALRSLRTLWSLSLPQIRYCEVLPRVWARSFFTSFTVLLTVMSTRSLPISFVDGCGSPVRPLLTRGGAFGSFARPRPAPPPRCGVSPRSRASRAAFHCSGVWPVASNGTVLYDGRTYMPGSGSRYSI